MRIRWKIPVPFPTFRPLASFLFSFFLLLLLLSTLRFFLFFFLFFVIWKWIGGFLLISYSASSLCINGAGLGMYKGRGWKGLRYNGYRFESYFLLYEIRKFLENVIFFIAVALSTFYDARTNRRIFAYFAFGFFYCAQDLGIYYYERSGRNIPSFREIFREKFVISLIIFA